MVPVSWPRRLNEHNETLIGERRAVGGGVSFAFLLPTWVRTLLLYHWRILFGMWQDLFFYICEETMMFTVLRAVFHKICRRLAWTLQ